MTKYDTRSYAETYAGLWSYGNQNELKRTESFYQYFQKRALKGMKRVSQYTILDVGCGVGRTSADLARALPASKVLGIEPSEEMIRLARLIVCSKRRIRLPSLASAGFPHVTVRGLGLKNVTFRKQTLEEFHREKENFGTFDLILMVNVLDRLENIDSSLLFLFDLLKPGGRLVISTPLNFQNATQWRKYGDITKFKKAIRGAGFHINHLVDGIPYQEQLDARGSFSEYKNVYTDLGRMI